MDEVEVRQALHGLEDEHLAGPVRGDGRVAKYEHHLQEVFNFTRGEIAIVCVLLLRGPQTPGELRGRTERMYKFEELSDVQNTLQKLMSREQALVKVLPRQPGTKEARYAHLLSGDVESFEAPQQSSSSYASSHAISSSSAAEDPEEVMELRERMAQLEAEVAILTRELSEVRHEVERLAKLVG